MMTGRSRDVKPKDGKLARMRCRFDDLKCFIDAHPRIGWYIAGLATINTLLNLLDLFVH